MHWFSCEVFIFLNVFAAESGKDPFPLGEILKKMYLNHRDSLGFFQCREIRTSSKGIPSSSMGQHYLGHPKSLKETISPLNVNKTENMKQASSKRGEKNVSEWKTKIPKFHLQDHFFKPGHPRLAITVQICIPMEWAKVCPYQCLWNGLIQA